jgi:hypothetical protein
VRARFPGHPPERLVGELIREQIGAMVNDVLVETRRRLYGILADGPEGSDAAEQEEPEES